MASGHGCGALCSAESDNLSISISTSYDSDENCDCTSVDHVVKSQTEFPAGTSITVQQSQGTHIGNNTYIHGGRVLIKQIVHENQQRECIERAVETSYLIPRVESSKKWKRTKKCTFAIVILLLVLISVFLLIYFLEMPLLNEFHIIPNTDFLSKPMKPGKPLSTPVPYVIICHTATKQCVNQTSCTSLITSIQASHINDRFLTDIGFNFLIGGDGLIYEGRGWDTVGVHTTGYNEKSIGVALIGTFQKIEPPEQQLAALKKLLELGVKLKKIDKNYKLFGQKQLTAALSPGQLLFNVLKTWDHFSLKP